MSAGSVRRVEIHVVDVTPKTRWTFIEVETSSGIVGTGEATLSGRENDLRRGAGLWADRVLGLSAPSPGGLQAFGDPATLVEAALRSALDQALWDVEARVRRTSLVGALGGARRERVPLYANVNRRTLDRSPEGFAASARDALAAGFEAVKIAPFDEVTPAIRRDGRATMEAEGGLRRIAAVRDAIGPRRDLMVDCHWRLDEAAAGAVIRAAAELGVHWVECPLPEVAESLPVLRRLRGLANGRGVRLAGCEEAIGLAGFEPFLAAGAYDVMMPDVKYVGGLAEMLRVAERLAAAGVAVSPHNPSGPIAHAASLHVSAALPAFDRLEVQFDESPLFGALVRGGLPAVLAGGAQAPPPGLGLGVALDSQALAGRSAGGRYARTPEPERLGA